MLAQSQGDRGLRLVSRVLDRALIDGEHPKQAEKNTQDVKFPRHAEAVVISEEYQGKPQVDDLVEKMQYRQDLAHDGCGPNGEGKFKAPPHEKERRQREIVKDDNDLIQGREKSQPKCKSMHHEFGAFRFGSVLLGGEASARGNHCFRR